MLNRYIKGDGFGRFGKPEVISINADLEFGGELLDRFFVKVEVVEGKTASGVEVLPSEGSEDGIIRFVVQIAQGQDFGLGFSRIVEAVIGGGESFIIFDQIIRSARNL